LHADSNLRCRFLSLFALFPHQLEEEMSLSGPASAWVSLGSYRVNVNRGHGLISCFLLLGARPLSSAATAASAGEEYHVDELEKQRGLELTLEELEQAVREQRFKEIKWQATASMAIAEVRRRIQEEDERIDRNSGLQLQQQQTQQQPLREESAVVKESNPVFSGGAGAVNPRGGGGGVGVGSRVAALPPTGVDTFALRMGLHKKRRPAAQPQPQRQKQQHQQRPQQWLQQRAKHGVSPLAKKKP
jgi:hypothetical protein